MSLVADKNKMSHRTLAQVLSVVVHSCGGELDSFPISHRTINRARDSKRQSMASAQKDEDLSNITGDIDQKNKLFYNLHWDGKKLKNLGHAKKRQEVLAIL